MKFIIAATAAALVLVPSAMAAGGDYSIIGGTPVERNTITQALTVSKFPWALAGHVDIVVTTNPDDTHQHGAWSTPGRIIIQSGWLETGPAAYSLVQHEMAHQVDDLYLTNAQRSALNTFFGVSAWIGDETGSDSGSNNQYGGMRFAEEVPFVYGSGPSWADKEDAILWRPALLFDTELVHLGIIPAPLLHHPRRVCRNVRVVKRVHGVRRVVIQRRCQIK